MALHFSRDTKLYVESSDTTGANVSSIWEVPVLDGFSLSQATNSSEITLNEAGATSRRARLLFNDSLAPVEWSFSTYMRPFAGSATNGYTTLHAHAVEEVLWAMYGGATGFDGNETWGAGASSPISYTTTTAMTVGLDSSNISYYPEGFNLYFSFSDNVATKNAYKIEKAVVNSVTMDFDIDGLATITWSGFGSLMVDQQGVSPQTPVVTHDDGITGTGSFIRNRLSTLSLIRQDVSPTVDYGMVLTGGSITFENNVNYLTPEEIGSVNQPLGNVTGARSITGNITAYLDTTGVSTAELLADLVADTTTVRNVFALSIFIGGAASGGPNVEFSLPTAHLEIPNPSVEDVISVDMAFHGQVAGGNVDNTDEATIVYRLA